MHEHPRHDAGRAVAEPRERDAERDEHDQRFQQSVRKPEGQADEHDRRPPAEEAEQRLTGAAEGQLLDERRDDGKEDEIRGERGRVLRLPVDVGEALLLAGAFGQWQLETTASQTRIATTTAAPSPSARPQLRGRRSASRSKRWMQIRRTIPSDSA